MANYQITNRTGAEVKAVLDKFTSTASPTALTLTGAISGGSLSITGAISGGSLSITGAISGGSLSVTGAITGGATLVVGSQKSGTTLGNYATILGYQGTACGNYSYAIGKSAIASEEDSIAIGRSANASAAQSVAIGYLTEATQTESFAFGFQSRAHGSYSIAAGQYAETTGQHAIAMGANSLASGWHSVAIGNSVTASGHDSHAEGGRSNDSNGVSLSDWTPETGVTIKGPLASGNNSHAEGCQTYAKGYSSHAEGRNTIASGDYSHAGGFYTIAQNDSNTAIGRYNTSDINAPFLIGNGLLYNGTALRWSSFWINWQGSLNISPYGSITNGAISQATAGNSWIDATHIWNIATPTVSALNLWDVPNDGGFHTWMRQRTANHYYVMGLIPSVNGFYIATNPAGANTATNAISKMLNWSGANGSLSISGSLSQGSDRRLKNIYGNTTEEETLAILENVNIVNFSYKYDNDVENNIRNGIIAQDLQQILEEHNIKNRAYLTTVNFPRNEALIESIENEEEFWDEDEMTKEFLGISYVDLVPILIKGWQIHEEKINSLEERIAQLEQLINKEQ